MVSADRQRTVRLILCAVFLVFGIFLWTSAYSTYSDRQNAFQTTAARFNVDLSKAGTYSGRLQQTYDGTATLRLVIDTTPRFRSSEELHAGLTAFHGQLIVRDETGQVLLDRDIDSFTALILQGQDGSWATPEMTFRALAPGDYDLSLIVIEPASQMGKRKQELLVHYSYLTKKAFIVPVCVGSISMAIGVAFGLSFWRRRARSQALDASQFDRSRFCLCTILIVFGLLDGLLLWFYGNEQLSNTYFVASWSRSLPWYIVLTEVARVVTALSLVATCIGLIARRKWAMILSYAQLPLRVLYWQFTFRFLYPLYPVLAHRGQSALWLLYWTMTALEVGRVIATAHAHRRLWGRRAPEDEASPAISREGRPWLKWISVGWAVLALGGVAVIGTGAVYRSIHSATLAGDQSAVRIRLALWPDSLNAKNADGDTPLHVAVQREARSRHDAPMTSLLLEEGANPNAKGQNGSSPLHLAVTSRPVVTTLLEHGADANVRNDSGATPLHHAAGANKLMVIRLLLAHKADPNAQDNAGTTPLHDTNLWHRKAAVRILLEAGADPNIADKKGRTLLHVLVDEGMPDPTRHYLAHNREVVALLISHGANVNARDKTGQSPLHLVVSPWNGPEEHRLAIAKMLLDAKADPGAKNAVGKTPLEMAEQQDTEALAKLLRQYRSP